MTRIFVARFGACCIGMMALGLTVPSSLAQDWREQIGYNKLRSEVGAGLENGAGVNVSVVEDGGANFTFLPDASNSEFSGKTIVNGTGQGTNPSSHATSVGQTFFGNTSSIAPGVTSITAYDALNWIVNRNAIGSASNPLPNLFSVQNHSYVAGGAADAVALEALARFDYLINRDGVTSVVGMNNGDSTTLPQLMGQSYNSISVGRTDGQHSHGLTTLGQIGRIKPDIVAPSAATSLSTPMVSGAATILHQKAANMGAIDARRPETMKAILMAGATKTEFANWDQGTTAGVITRPLDDVFGAGELNVDNSYRILEGGEFDGSTANVQATAVAFKGWDYGEGLAANNQMNWTIDVASGQIIGEASVLLTWNAEYVDANGNFVNSRSLANMRLQLWDSTNSFKGVLLATSDSPFDNVEHLYLKDLAAGKYTFGVTTDLATDFGLAWNFNVTAVPEPSSIAFLGLAGFAFLSRQGYRAYRKREIA